MKVLLLHPEDSVWAGSWSRERWDLIIDLGFASPSAYEEWSSRLGTRVRSIHQYNEQTEGYRWVNGVLQRGRGRLLDRMGLDWWEIVGAAHYQGIHLLYLAGRVGSDMPAGQIEIAASRPHLFARMFGQGLGCAVRYFQSGQLGVAGRAARMLRSARRLRPAQITEIAFDKWDPSYRMRRRISQHKRAELAKPAILMPSAYWNVTRSVLAYALQLPHRGFLLATTRRNALPDHLPENVTVAPLAAYVPAPVSSKAEIAELLRGWEGFRVTMQKEAKEFRQAISLGMWDHFPVHFANGLRLRDAWKRLLECEPITGVLCGDDLNYYTRLPLMLANRSGLTTVYCSHGALDGGFLFKMPQAEAYLVKGEMERDYLQRSSAIDPAKICVGAPGKNACAEMRDSSRGELVFFSQPYEVEGGRADIIYRELLPHLCSTATRGGRKVIVKLHPFESMRERTALVTSILPKPARSQVELVGAMPGEEVMSHAWCGVTVDSSVAVEGTLRNIPFFLCGWLDFIGTEYLQQFARFGAGRVLNSPEEIENIPAMVAEYRSDPALLQRLRQEADQARLDEIMFGTRQVRLHSCAC